MTKNKNNSKNNKKENSKIISFINQFSNNIYIYKSWKEITTIFLDSMGVILPRGRWTNFVAIIPCPTD